MSGIRIGIGNLKINPYWELWWSSLISATVEDAAPTHIVLVFPTGRDLGTDDFTVTIDGEDSTITDVSWDGGECTITVDDTITEDDDVIVTFVTTGETAGVTNNTTWEYYWAHHLDTWYRSRTELVLNENQVPFVGEILPSVAHFGVLTDHDYIKVSDADIFSFTNGSNDLPFSIEIVFKTPAFNRATAVVYPAIGKDSGGTDREWALILFSTNAGVKYSPRIFIKSEGGGNQKSIDGDISLADNTWYKLFLTYSGNATYQGLNIYNGATALSKINIVDAAYTHMNNTDASLTFANYALISYCPEMQISYCKIYNVELSQAQITSIVAGGTVDDIFYMPMVGNQRYEYDLTGGRNGQRLGIGPTKEYSFNGSPYCLDNGWSLWNNERVPFGATTTEIEALGFTEDVVFPASAGFINMADCKLDFDPDTGTNALLDMFDRSNTTIYNAAARASVYYNALFPYQFQIDEIANYEVYSGYLNAAYIDRLMTKVQKSGGFVMRLDEILNSPTVM